jgi:carbonic anhydrase
MQRRALIKHVSLFSATAAFSLGFSSLRAAVAGETSPEWGYEGSLGPDHWGDLSPEYAACKQGQGQSPINLQGDIPAILPILRFQYHPIPLKLIHNGHTIQVNADAGNSITLQGTDFELLQFHFHHPSEHTIRGNPFPMEAHFVHRSAQGELAVVGVMMEIGRENQALLPVWKAMPTQAGAEQVVSGVTLDLHQIVPFNHAGYRYFGSLTTPPCSEIVRWIVLQQPIAISQAQADQFANLFPHNARPVQPLHRRFLLHSH